MQQKVYTEFDVRHEFSTPNKLVGYLVFGLKKDWLFEKAVAFNPEMLQ